MFLFVRNPENELSDDVWILFYFCKNKGAERNSEEMLFSPFSSFPVSQL